MTLTKKDILGAAMLAVSFIGFVALFAFAVGADYGICSVDPSRTFCR